MNINDLLFACFFSTYGNVYCWATSYNHISFCIFIEKVIRKFSWVMTMTIMLVWTLTKERTLLFRSLQLAKKIGRQYWYLVNMIKTHPCFILAVVTVNFMMEMKPSLCMNFYLQTGAGCTQLWISFIFYLIQRCNTPKLFAVMFQQAFIGTLRLWLIPVN